jgi:hypothetical protein
VEIPLPWRPSMLFSQEKPGGWAQYGAVHLIYCAVQHI